MLKLSDYKTRAKEHQGCLKTFGVFLRKTRKLCYRSYRPSIVGRLVTSEVLLLEVKGNTGKIFLETEIGMDDVARQRMQSKVQFRMSTFNNFAKIIQGEVNWTDSRSDYKKRGCGGPKKCFEAEPA